LRFGNFRILIVACCATVFNNSYYSFFINAADLESNAKKKPQVLSNLSISNACSGQGRTNKCKIQLDVPEACVTNGKSDCPIVFYLHGAGGNINGYKFESDVHKHGFIGVYPQGENGWNTGPKDTNECEWDEFDCTQDPDESKFIAEIIAEVNTLGANGNVYLIGSSNGAALANRLAVNAGEDAKLPIKGIVTLVSQLLANPPQSGPEPSNYNNPEAVVDDGQPKGPIVSVLNVMGTDDDVIPYEGGGADVFEGNDEFQLMSAMDSMIAWAQHNGCSPFLLNEPVTTNMGDKTGFYYYASCPDGIYVEHYTLEGAGHDAGEAKVEGVRIQYDIAATFIDKCESNVESKAPTKAPSPTTDCVDDPDWFHVKNEDHDCLFVSLKPDKRCGWKNSADVLASEACKEACSLCSSPPTLSPVANPDDRFCDDDVEYEYKGKNCGAVYKKNTKLCGKKDKNIDKKVKEMCPIACKNEKQCTIPACLEGWESEKNTCDEIKDMDKKRDKKKACAKIGTDGMTFGYKACKHCGHCNNEE